MAVILRGVVYQVLDSAVSTAQCIPIVAPALIILRSKRTAHFHAFTLRVHESKIGASLCKTMAGSLVHRCGFRISALFFKSDGLIVKRILPDVASSALSRPYSRVQPGEKETVDPCFSRRSVVVLWKRSHTNP